MFNYNLKIILFLTLKLTLHKLEIFRIYQELIRQWLTTEDKQKLFEDNEFSLNHLEIKNGQIKLLKIWGHNCYTKQYFMLNIFDQLQCSICFINLVIRRIKHFQFQKEICRDYFAQKKNND
ncbi:unnamed protein product [Paramecium sonneborni]|uniref:Transmembrane protein n=1 Tax=Paramecium sonneborni TaxID=65129 RepID=A0A8S1MSJ2_9CILI|nr:unnamed protein product [Paramecium sonneborni]